MWSGLFAGQRQDPERPQMGYAHLRAALRHDHMCGCQRAQRGALKRPWKRTTVFPSEADAARRQDRKCSRARRRSATDVDDLDVVGEVDPLAVPPRAKAEVHVFAVEKELLI